ncbi:hypothetical protein D3C72_2301790 [compost metagenome]
MSVSDWPDALYLTANSGACADFTNSANTTCAVVLGSPTFNAFGCERARSINCATLLAGRSAAEVQITIGSRPIMATPAKSVTGS